MPDVNIPQQEAASQPAAGQSSSAPQASESGQPASAAPAGQGQTGVEAGDNQQPAAKPAGNLLNSSLGQTGQQSQQPVDPEHAPMKEACDLGLGEACDPDLADSFNQQAIELGLTPSQARSLAKWQLQQTQILREQMVQAGCGELRQEWGSQAAANQSKLLAAISQVDRALYAQNPNLGEQSFSKALDRCGATCDAAVLRGLLTLCAALDEDTAKGLQNAAGLDKPEDPLDAMKQLFK